MDLIQDFLTHFLLESMYRKEPEYKQNEGCIFRNHISCIFYGIIIILFFYALTYLINDIIEWFGVYKESNSITYDYMYKGIMAFLIIFIIVGVNFILSPFTKKIILREDEIIYKGLFWKKKIKFEDITIVKFSKTRGLIFKEGNKNVVFGPFMGGLIYMIKFIEVNIDNRKCWKAVETAKKMIARNSIEVQW